MLHISISITQYSLGIKINKIVLKNYFFTSKQSSDITKTANVNGKHFVIYNKQLKSLPQRRKYTVNRCDSA